MKNFALAGIAGYIAPRHLKAIRDTGNRLVAATDPHDAVGILDSYFSDTAYFREFERFDRHLEKLRRGAPENRVHYVSICSPNHLHDAHIRLALRIGADAICEKPLVLNPWNLDALQRMEHETGQRVWTILQLRMHPTLRALRERLLGARPAKRHEIILTYVTSRGPWYQYSWKGDPAKSGGVPTNIGIHFFDLLLWIFGRCTHSEVHLSTPSRTAGFLELERANVVWYLSIDKADIPAKSGEGCRAAHRSITVDGVEIEFTDGFADLHTKVYQETLDGRGFGIEDARPSIEVVQQIRTVEVVRPLGPKHPLLITESSQLNGVPHGAEGFTEPRKVAYDSGEATSGRASE
ncbi:MAG: Gfo/Idh/MocA family oxidoreductase [Thermoanaerobaculia bacterium]|nr:Gfo/Idh/MocA family oxidoreductase [Thermoanaerobaculia bacterium]